MNASLSSHQIKIVLESAARLAEQFKNSEIGIKADRTPVTEADRAVSSFLRRELCSLEPDAAWLCEEDCADPARQSARQCWIVDPLDGTQEFIAGIPEYAVSVALVRAGEPKAAGIVNPATGEGGAWVEGEAPLFWGWSGAPSGTMPSSSDCRVVVSRGEIERGTARELVQQLPGVRGVGSAAYKLLRVAAGHDDLYVSMEPKSEWDICGGVGLLSAVGKTYRLFSGASLGFNRESTRIKSGAVGGAPELVEWFFSTFRTTIAQTAYGPR